MGEKLYLIGAKDVAPTPLNQGTPEHFFIEHQLAPLSPNVEAKLLRTPSLNTSSVPKKTDI
jgi:hypothetical protein